MNIQRLLVTAAVLVATAAPAAAQIGFQVSYGSHHRGRSFQIAVGSRPHLLRGVHHRHRHHGLRHRHHGLRHRHHGLRHHRFRYVTERVRVWVPGCTRRVYVPARYGYRYDDCGRRVRYCIVPARYEIVREPGRWEYRRRHVRVRG